MKKERKKSLYRHRINRRDVKQLLEYYFDCAVYTFVLITAIFSSSFLLSSFSLLFSFSNFPPPVLEMIQLRTREFIE